jgi:hypothetical protein
MFQPENTPVVILVRLCVGDGKISFPNISQAVQDDNAMSAIALECLSNVKKFFTSAPQISLF